MTTPELFRPTWCQDEADQARELLGDRTHYADADTLKYFGARVVASDVIAGGAAAYLIETIVADRCGHGDEHGSRRIYRLTVFAIDGLELTRGPDAPHGKVHTTREGAFSELHEWTHANARTKAQRRRLVTDAFARARAALRRELDQLTDRRARALADLKD